MTTATVRFINSPETLSGDGTAWKIKIRNHRNTLWICGRLSREDAIAAALDIFRRDFGDEIQFVNAK